MHWSVSCGAADRPTRTRQSAWPSPPRQLQQRLSLPEGDGRERSVFQTRAVLPLSHGPVRVWRAIRALVQNWFLPRGQLAPTAVSGPGPVAAVGRVCNLDRSSSLMQPGRRSSRRQACRGRTRGRHHLRQWLPAAWRRSPGSQLPPAMTVQRDASPLADAPPPHTSSSESSSRLTVYPQRPACAVKNGEQAHQEGGYHR